MAELQEKQNANILDKDISDVLHDSMLPYSEHVILERALPRVEDGLKPVQRRILYSMLDLGVTPDKPYRKSARIVGDCLGKYHPHGDTSVYGAMVRMAQPFNQNVVLVDGHGNFGSVDGDSPAAMRYTEVRLMPIALELLRDLEKDTVKWSLNFDDSCKEPDTLPGRYPNLLVNGASGIAVGLATNIPPHNITEVIDGVCAYIDNPKITLDEMMQYIPAPDFPTGGQLLVDDDMRQAYATGKGKVALRSKVSIEKDGDKYSIVVTELPYQVNKASLLRTIDGLKEKKKDIFGNIGDIVDESDRRGMRAVIKIKREGNPKKILEDLYKYTDLQTNFSLNMVAIAEGKPQLLGLMQIIKFYVDYQRKVIYRRSQYELQNAKAREHILQGIIIAIENIDEVIKIIKSSASVADCRERLRERFGISEKQAQAILDIKLARLTKLEVTNLREEIAQLLKTIEYLTGVVKSNAKQLSIVKSELAEIRKKYKTERKSRIFIKGIEQKIQICDVNYVEERKGIALLTSGQNIKFLSNRSYSTANKSINTDNSKDIVLKALQCDNNSPIFAFSNTGNVYNINVNDLTEDKWRNRGTSISKLLSLKKDECIINIFTQEEIQKNQLLFMTANGMLKCSNGEEYTATKKPYVGINLKDGDEVVSVEIKENDKTVLMVTEGGICLNMVSDCPVQGRKSSGVIGMALNSGDKVIFATQIDDEGEIAVITDNGYTKKVIAGLIKVSNRNRKGIKIHDFNGKNGNKLLFGCYVKYGVEIAVIGENGEVCVIHTDNIRIENPNSRGVAIKNISGNIARIYSNNLIDIIG